MINATENIQQTVENTRYVFASTDTTAIFSFLVAAVVGVFLAWWFGKKSFDLTTQSFDATIKQIEASINAARENTEKTFQMNRDLIQSQKEIQHKELNFKYMIDWIINFDNLSSEYLGQVFSYVKLINVYIMRDELALSDIDKAWDNHCNTLDEIDIKLQKVSILKFKLLLLLSKKSELEIKINDDLNFLDDWIRSEYVTNCFANKINIDLQGLEYLQFINRVNQCKENISELRLRITSEQLDSI